MLVTAVVLLTACSSNTPTSTAEGKQPAPAAQKMNEPGIDLNCVATRLQNPPDAFHYSFKNNGNPEFVDDEADVTPQSIDGYFTTNTNDVTKPPINSKVHAVRSDADGWGMAAGSLGGIMALAGVGDFISESAVRETTEEVNGYDTTRYSVDTTRGDADRVAIMLGSGGFIKGTVWVTSDGCPVKMTLDQESHHRDGSVAKNHFEEAIVKQ